MEVCDVFCREQYSEILRKRWVEVFNRIFDEDNYTAISVESPDEYHRIASVYPFRDAVLEQVRWFKMCYVTYCSVTVDVVSSVVFVALDAC